MATVEEITKGVPKKYTLKHWQIAFVKEKEGKRKYIAYGLVHGHPRFREGYDIHTSYIESVELCEACLRVQTMNSVYELPFYSCNPYRREDSFWEDEDIWKKAPDKDAINNLKEEIKAATRAEKLRLQAERETKIEDSKECFVMSFNGNNSDYFEDAFVKGIASDGSAVVHHFEPFVHVGNFQDSVLLSFDDEEFPNLQGADPEEARSLFVRNFDFRYFPYFGNHIEFYSWGDYNGDIYFINQGYHVLRVDTPFGKFKLPPDKVAYRIWPDANAPRWEENIEQ